MLDPIAFQIGPFSIHWYGVIMGSAFLFGSLLAMRQAKRVGINPDHILNMLTWIIPSAILGARTYYVLFEWQQYKGSLYDIIAIWEGGLAIHGGLIGGTIAGVFYARKHRLAIPQMADILAPSIILGQAIGRWGNFMNQEAHGGLVSEAFISKFPKFIKNQMFINGQYYHPTFLYESLWNLGVFSFLIIYRGKKRIDGEVALLYLSLYSTGRFFIEGMRTDSLMLGPLRVAQLVSLTLFVLSIGLIIFRRWGVRGHYPFVEKEKGTKIN